MNFTFQGPSLQARRHAQFVIGLVIWVALGMLAPQASEAQQPAQPQTTPQSKSGNNGTLPDKSGPSASPDDDAGTTRLKIVVTNSQDKPVANASVYIRFGDPGKFFHKDRLAEMNFKTNGDGSVKVPDVPIGKVLIQIVAKGLHTYGKWYDITKNSDTIQIKLDPPPHWY